MVVVVVVVMQGDRCPRWPEAITTTTIETSGEKRCLAGQRITHLFSRHAVSAHGYHHQKGSYHHQKGRREAFSRHFARLRTASEGFLAHVEGVRSCPKGFLGQFQSVGSA